MNSALYKNYLTTFFGILAGLPTLVLGSGITLDAKATHYLMLVAGVGTIGLGVVSKAFNVHSTVDQVEKSTAASEQAAPAKDAQNVVKILLIACLVGIAVVPARAQDVSNLYAAGVSFNSSAAPRISGTGLYARKVGDSGTYAFTVVDALPNTTKPFTVTSNFGAGVAQKVYTIGKVPIFIPTAAGVSYNGTNTGWAWSTGALASIRVKNSWRILPNVRIAKSSVSNGSGYQPIVGILFGWGQ